MGGDMMGSGPDDVRCALCDLEPDGGGPGGGGGTGTCGSHLTCDDDRDRPDVGVATAGVDAARRDPGAMPIPVISASLRGGISTVIGAWL